VPLLLLPLLLDAELGSLSPLDELGSLSPLVFALVVAVVEVAVV